jgi:membrane-associated protein
MGWIVDYFLKIDQYLGDIINNYQSWTYLFLFIVIFCETGLVVMPFLPGDSLLFAAGAFAAQGDLNLGILFATLFAAAILGDTVNYGIGHYAGDRVHFKDNARILKKKYLDETHDFYDKHGKGTIVLARFVPIVRTLAPFVAGLGRMHYRDFLRFNVIGGMAWVILFVGAGFFFGSIGFVKDNFSMVIMAIVLISVLPILIKYLQERRKNRKAGSAALED